MVKLFEETTINGLRLKNRFVLPALYDGMGNADGSCSQMEDDSVTKSAKGGVGMIITGATFVNRVGRAYVGQAGLCSDDPLPGLTRMTQSVHQADASIFPQLFHAGLFANPEYAGQDALGPSVMITEKGPQGQAMTRAQIHGTVAAFGEAAARAKVAGFDGVQVHASGGYLASQFLSPFFNHREDEYVGSIENRARLLLEMVRSVREAAGRSFPLLVKLNSEVFLPNGLSVDDMLRAAKMLEQAGVDATELTGRTILGLLTGSPNTSFSRVERNGLYYEQAAKRYKAEVGIPLILVGWIRSLQEAQRLVDGGITDYVSVGHPLIREPELIQRWQEGDTRDSACVSDNLCLFEGLKGNGVHCVHVKE